MFSSRLGARVTQGLNRICFAPVIFVSLRRGGLRQPDYDRAIAAFCSGRLRNGAIASAGRPALSSSVANTSRGATCGGAAGLGDRGMARTWREGRSVANAIAGAIVTLPSSGRLKNCANVVCLTVFMTFPSGCLPFWEWIADYGPAVYPHP